VQYHSNKDLFTIDHRVINWRIESIPANDIYLLEIKSPSTIKTFRKLFLSEIENIQELFPNPVGEKNKH
jgi:hypothetical protein